MQKENKHIRVWERLIPGTKLKIPTISEAVDQDINSMEPFVEDYYPKLKLDVGAMVNPNPEIPVESVQVNLQNNQNNQNSQNSQNSQNNQNIPKVENEILQTAETNEIKTLSEENQTTINKLNVKPNIADIPELKHYQNAGAQAIQPVLVNPYQYPYLAYYSYPRYVYPQYVYPVYVYPQYQNKQ